MKKILVMVLCLIMAAMPVVAEELPVINIEKVENLAAELGFEGATGEELVLPAGEGYYVLWREDLLSMYVYCPDSGWNAVKADGIDESWAVTELYVYAEKQNSYEEDIDVAEFFDENVEKYGSAAAAVLQLVYGEYSCAYKGKDYILLDDVYGTHLVIELSNFNAHIIDAMSMYVYDIFIDAEGQMLCYDGERNLKYIDYDVNTLTYVDLRSYIDYSGIRKIFDNGDEYVVLYDNADSEFYAAWISKQGEVVQNVYLTNGNANAKILYSKETDTLIYNKTFHDRCVTLLANRDGRTQAILNIKQNEGWSIVTMVPEDITYEEDARIVSIAGYGEEVSITGTFIPCLIDDGRYALMLHLTRQQDVYLYSASLIDLETFSILEINTNHIESDMLEEMVDLQWSAKTSHDIWHGDDLISYEGITYRVTEQ